MTAKARKIVIFLTYLVVITSCSTNRELVVSSKEEQMTVSIITEDKANYKEIGKTPLKLNDEKLPELKKHDLIGIRLTKPGHVTENFLISYEGRNIVKIHAAPKLISDWTAPNSEISSMVANKIVNGIQKINTLVRKGKYDQALKSVDQMIDNFPSAHMLYDLRGSIFILRGDKGRGIASYEKSLRINPDNQKTKSMLGKLKKDKQ